MQITRLEKKKHLYLLEIDNSETYYITEDTLVKFMLTKQMILDDETFSSILSFSQFSRGKNKALYYLSFKQRTNKEIQTYLEKHDIDSAVISSIIDELVKENWLNDYRYAEQFLQYAQENGDKGPYLLAQKLKSKGIEKHIIDDLLSHYDSSYTLNKQAEKIFHRYQQKLPYQALKIKITQQLTNKGFAFSDVKTAIENLELKKEDNLEEQLLAKELDKLYRKLNRRYDGTQLRQRLIQNLIRKGYSYSSISQAVKDYF